MRVFVAGATGAIGRQLVPLLLTAGHKVTGMTRSEARADALRATGADALIVDALDQKALEAAVTAARPEVVVHQLTAIPARIDPRDFALAFEATNRIRRAGTANLVAAASAAGARRLLAQSIAQAYKPIGGWVKEEDDPLYDDAPTPFHGIFNAVIALETAVLAADGLEPFVLRYGNFYGPGTRFAVGGSDADLVRAQQFPVAGGGPARWSFIHVRDAAEATVHALENGERGVYNIVDDEPAPVAEWLPAYAKALGAPPPPSVGEPRNEYGRFGMLHARGASNAKARVRLAWEPRYTSWREGFEAELA